MLMHTSMILLQAYIKQHICELKAMSLPLALGPICIIGILPKQGGLVFKVES